MTEVSAVTVSFMGSGQGTGAPTIAKKRKICYYDLMRSQSVETLEAQVNALDSSGMLHHTLSQRRHADHALEAVPYFVIPAGVAHQVGKIVTSYVHLNTNGILDAEAPKAYGVVERPTEGKVEHSAIRLREAHVLAEDFALRKGLWTPTGRAVAELYVAKAVAEDANAESYVPDRIAHLGALAVDIEQEDLFRFKRQIIDELERGQETLQDYLDATKQG